MNRVGEGGDLRRILLLDILNSTTTLDTANSKTCGIGETTNYPSLPLKWTLHRLVKCRGVLEVDDVDVLVRRPNDAQVTFDVHRIDAVLACHRRGGPLLAHVPVLDSLVPGARGHHGVSVGLEEADGSHGLVVGSNDNILL